MREALKNLFAKQVTLEDGTIFSYTISPYEMKNALGKTVDLLNEYSFIETNTNTPFQCKLYKTKENNWYDFEDTRNSFEKNIVRKLKAAVDGNERFSLAH